MKFFSFTLLISILSGCGINFSPINTNVKELRHKNGEIVWNCNGRTIPLRAGGDERFWRENNLPKGTTDFVCKNGKAYLPDQVPSN